jgi:hypothetical protein
VRTVREVFDSLNPSEDGNTHYKQVTEEDLNNLLNEFAQATRDWMAGQALIGLCSYSGSYGATNGPGDLATRSYEIADAMIEARSK